MRRRPGLIGLAGTSLATWPAVAIAANFLTPVLPEPVACSDDFAGGLSADGNTIALNRTCYSPTTGNGERRAIIARDFRNPAASPSLQTIGGWVFDLAGDGRSAAATIPVANPLDPEYPFDRGALIRDTGETLEIGALLPDFHFNASSYAYALSSQGDVLVGAAPNESGRSWPVVWSQAAGLQAIEFVAEPGAGEEWPAGSAVDVSGDGRFVAGSFGSFGAFLWSADAGLHFLSDPNDPLMRMENARAISQDGSVVVGDGIFEGIAQPVLWSQATGLVGLGPTDTITLGQVSPRAISGDGRIVVGGARSFLPHVEIDVSGDRAFFWTPDSGIQSLRHRLEDIGVLTSAWQFLDSAWAVSADGSTVAGGGRRIGSDAYETFFADLREATSRGVDLCDETDPDCVRVEIVARSGQLVRFDPWADQVIVTFEQARLNQAGGVAFLANTVNHYPGPIEAGRALFGPDGQGRARLCAASRTPAPTSEAPGAIVSAIDPFDFALDADGQLVFNGQWREDPFGSTSVPALLRCNAATETAELQIRAGAPLTAPMGAAIDALYDWSTPNFQLAPGGRLAFGAQILPATGEPARPGLVVSDPGGGLRRLIGAGDAIPGYPSDVLYGATAFYAMNANGSLVFTGWLDETASNSPPRLGVFAADSSGTIHTVIRPGDPAPGQSSTTTFFDGPDLTRSARRAAINVHGEVAALTFTRDAEDPVPRPRPSIWRWSPEQPLSHVVSPSDAFPGLADGMQITWLDEPWIDDAGDLLIFAFISDVTGVDAGGFWLRTPEGSLLPLLRSGQAAPDLPQEVVLADAYDDDFIDPPLPLAMAALAANGRSLMEFQLAGPGIDSTNDRALFTVDRNGDARLVIRRGARIEVAHEDVRTIDAFRVDYGDRSGLGRSPINERGEIAAVLDFTDGSQAVAKLALPEPRGMASWATLVLVIGALGRARPSARTHA